MSDTAENQEIQSHLIDIGTKWEAEGLRCLRGGIVPPAAPKPSSLEDYRSACHELGVDEILSNGLRQYYEDILNGKDLKKIASIFHGGSTICLAVIPFTTGGMPLGLREINQYKYFYPLLLEAADYTKGFGSNGAYYFPLLPMEIQAQCIFEVPFYENGVPNEDDIKILKERFWTCFDNLKRLLDKIPEQKAA